MAASLRGESEGSPSYCVILNDLSSEALAKEEVKDPPRGNSVDGDALAWTKLKLSPRRRWRSGSLRRSLVALGLLVPASSGSMTRWRRLRITKGAAHSGYSGNI